MRNTKTDHPATKGFIFKDVVNSIVTDGTFNAISFISGADIEKINKSKVI